MQAKDVNRAVAIYVQDAYWLQPNTAMLVGKEAIRAGWSQVLETPGFSVDWHIIKLEVSRSGDFAYTLSTYQATVQGTDAKPISDHGHDQAVWKKQPNGNWKIVADSVTSDLPFFADAVNPEAKAAAEAMVNRFVDSWSRADGGAYGENYLP